LLAAGAVVGLAPTEGAGLSRRTPIPDFASSAYLPNSSEVAVSTESVLEARCAPHAVLD
jgi:hypothetical protein